MLNKFLIVDTRISFYQDLSTRINIDDDLNIEADTFLYTNNAELQNKIVNGGYNAVVFSSKVLNEPDLNLPTGVAILGYLEKNGGSNEEFSKNGIYDLGVIAKSYELLETLEELDLDALSTASSQTTSAPASETTGTATTTVTGEPIAYGRQSFCTNCGAGLQPNARFCPSCGTKIDTVSAVAEETIEEPDDAVRSALVTNDENEAEIQRQVNEDLRVKKALCKLITVYAAKGGVGKTTIATSIAVLLAMTSTGRRPTKVCVVDYNIDFGDVRPTLGFSSKGVDMYNWSLDIDSKIENGEDPDDINYSSEDIENRFLQKKVFKKVLYGNDIEIYGLIAPILHEDSMNVSEDAISVMLRNLQENGDFDYIICDTGNNTRDSSFTALEFADRVLLINTQDVTTVSCNDSFLVAMKKLKFDLSKISLVINNIVPAKETGVSVKDIEETVPFPCIARIRRNNGVILANNKGIPLVFNANTQFTKEIQNIVSVITDEELQMRPKKKGLLSRFRKG